MLSWQKARVLAIAIYTLLKNEKDFDFRNQIQRAAVSIRNNIAEGSSGEVRSMLYLAKYLGKITEKDFNEFYALSVEISKLLSDFIRVLRKQN